LPPAYLLCQQKEKSLKHKLGERIMKVIITTGYGAPEVLQLQERPKPTPKENEILIKIDATSVSSGDARMRRADPFIIRLIFGFTKPRTNIFGYVLSGEVKSIGKNVTRFKIGDNIFATTGMKMGAYAEYICLAEDGVVAIKPSNISHLQAAAIPFGGNTALYFLNEAKIKQGENVLIYGASGAIGSAAVQLAKHFGAVVTAVCSTANLEMVKSLGADNVIDYTKEDFTQNRASYDIIFDTVGKSDFGSSVNSLTKNGRYLLSNAGPCQMMRGMWSSITSSKKVISGVMKETAQDLIFFKELIETGSFVPVIDKEFPLEQIAKAHAYVDKGHKKGNVVITVNQ